MIKLCQRLYTSAGVTNSISKITNNITKTLTVRNISITSFNSKEVRFDKQKVGTSKDHLAKHAMPVVRTDLESVDEEGLFPDAFTPNKLFDGVPYKDLFIVDITASPNNTKLSLTNSKGVVKTCHSCGCEGFKTAKKGTNVAAQQTATTFGLRALQLIPNGCVRLRVSGLGPGRAAAVKGLQLSGIKIVSITDSTRVSWNPCRPRKRRRV